MRCAVIGCGSIGQRHLRNLKALGVSELLAYDLDAGSLERVRQTLGVRVARSLDEVLATRPGAVLVCTPTHQHLPIALAAVRAGAHVFVEKPLAVSLEGIDMLQAAATSAGRQVLVGCNMRFHPGVAHLKRVLEEGRVRHPVLFRAYFSHSLRNWRPDQDYRRSYSASRLQGGGVILDGVHELDYLRWLAGEMRVIEAVGGHLSDLEIETEDVALIALQFESGALGQVHLDYVSPWKLRGCEIVGAEGIVRWSSSGKQPETVRVDAYDAAGGGWETLYACEAYDANEMYLEELQHVLLCAEGSARPLASLEDGRRVLELALAAQTAVERRGWHREERRLLSEKAVP